MLSVLDHVGSVFRVDGEHLRHLGTIVSQRFFHPKFLTALKATGMVAAQ